MARGQMARQPSRDSTDANTPARGGPFSHEHACQHRSDVGAEKDASEGEYDDGARFVGERAGDQSRQAADRVGDALDNGVDTRAYGSEGLTPQLHVAEVRRHRWHPLII